MRRHQVRNLSRAWRSPFEDPEALHQPLCSGDGLMRSTDLERGSGYTVRIA